MLKYITINSPTRNFRPTGTSDSNFGTSNSLCETSCQELYERHKDFDIVTLNPYN